ncbi:OmpA family protein [Flavobacterium sp.]|uniref:OmpA family protein n=1 Tax=Flavobacterium sp. TaxID=239 RepID=UPI00286D8B70|nr:OmpA family protein [Flavobacterium sp.]
MKTNNHIKIGSRQARSLNSLSVKSFILITLIWFAIQTPVQAQETQYTTPSWWFGAAVGSNFNFYHGSTQVLNADFASPATFHNGKGIGLYLAPLVEYHRPNTYWGFMFQAGFDNREGKFNQITTACNCPADLSTKLRYFTIEPSLRLAPFKSNFYVYAGPRIAFNNSKSFEYQLGINPNFPSQPASPGVNGDFSNIKNTIVSMQIGMGYDIPINSTIAKTQWIFSPFVAFQPYFGQNPRDIETWNLTTVRAGFTLKFGSGKEIESVKIVDAEVQFSVQTPKNEVVTNRMREVFPLRNYIFFNVGSTEIPDRYVLLTKNQVKDFKEDQVQFTTPKRTSGRSERQMVVYYNVINILGDRMQKFPSSTIKLVGSSEKGSDDGRAMATTVKNYLTSVFGIDSSRITVEGRVKPLIPSEQPEGRLELDLLREGDQRVTIETYSPELLMEFQSGDAPLKPVEIVSLEQNKNRDDIAFNVAGSKEAFTTWTLELKDENGKVKNFGPYSEDKVIVSRNTILKNQQQGNFNVTMVGQTKSGKTVRKETSVYILPYVAPQIQESIRFSVIYEFNESKSIAIYEKYLTEIVTPKIPNGGTVAIKGHTDIIGKEGYNQNLSLERANDVRSIIEKKLAKLGRTDVKFQIYGYGEDPNYSLFENKYPEERFYNRTVVIDLIPKN